MLHWFIYFVLSEVCAAVSTCVWAGQRAVPTVDVPHVREGARHQTLQKVRL